MNRIRCAICGDVTGRPIAAALSHFKPYQTGQWKFLRGNIKTFGLLSGIHCTVGLVFPIYTTLRYWKYRKAKLVIPEGAEVCITKEP